jgi:hypothetical protein
MPISLDEGDSVSNARSLADLLYRRNKGTSRASSTEPQPPEDQPRQPRTQPIPLRPGEVVDLPEVQDQEFPFEAGRPLPHRGSHGSAWSAVPLSAAVTDDTAAHAATGADPDADPEEEAEEDDDTVPTKIVFTGPTPIARPDPETDLTSALELVLAPSPQLYPRPVPAWPEPPRPAQQQDLRPRAPQLAQAPAPPSSPPSPAPVRKDYTVSNIETVLKEAMQIDGAIGVALVDYTSGMTLGQAGGSALNLDVAAAGNTEVVRAKLRTMEALNLHDGIEDILITLSSQYHLIRLINDQAGIGLFLYLALNKNKANLALARHKLAILERQIEI